jgi:putative Mg2+ transporter-C (MgtC) family protein
MNSLAIDPDNWPALTFRLVLSLVAGGAIGWNRQQTGKAAGLRTHMLVSLGAALFVMIPLLEHPSATMDTLSRAIQGVATGIGFLGAGEILHTRTQTSGKPRVKGLTSAASIWVTAALGVVAGCGLWQLSLMGTLMTILVLSGAKRLENWTSTAHEDDHES